MHSATLVLHKTLGLHLWGNGPSMIKLQLCDARLISDPMRLAPGQHWPLPQRRFQLRALDLCPPELGTLTSSV